MKVEVVRSGDKEKLISLRITAPTLPELYDLGFLCGTLERYGIKPKECIGATDAYIEVPIALDMSDTI